MPPPERKSDKQSSTFSISAISEYTLAIYNDPDDVVASVNRLIELGWRPVGGINVAVCHDPMIEVLFSQAMVR